jgi:hypothetical protein
MKRMNPSYTYGIWHMEWKKGTEEERREENISQYTIIVWRKERPRFLQKAKQGE